MNDKPANLQTVQLYGTIVVSIIITIGFIFILYLAYMKGDQHTVDTLVGVMGTMFIVVVVYWIGSSMGSQKKDSMLFAAQPLSNVVEKLPPPPKAIE